MKNNIFCFLSFFVLIAWNCRSQKAVSNLNLDFETVENEMPKDWETSPSSNYLVAIERTIVKKGKNAVMITYKEGTADFKPISYILPGNYEGKKITLSGYIKTENVTDGYASLYMRIDPGIGFENMEKIGVKGTTAWRKYEITLNMNPEKTKKIVIGGFLAGKGKMWMDDLQVSIDGKNITTLQPIHKEIYPAEKDKEFDAGSKISDITLDNNQINNLKNLGLVWGFLKYYHPAIADGTYNWDYELFRILPKVLQSKDANNRDAILVKWIASLGPVSAVDEKENRSETIKIQPDLQWISNSGFSNDLTAILFKIQHAKRMDNHYYYSFIPGVGNPEFLNENPYPKIHYPDAGFRILTLFRYWNIIQYFFPYKNLIAEDWKNILEEYIPKMIDAKNEKEYTFSILELIGKIKDTHANIWNFNSTLHNYYGKRYTDIEVTYIENKAVVTGLPQDRLEHISNIKIGDVITLINNKPVDEITKERLKYTPASNYPTQLRDIAYTLSRSNDSTISLELLRADKKITTQIKTYLQNELSRKVKNESNDTCFKILRNDIAYINNGTLKKKFLPEIWKNVQNKKGLIIDIRNYPSDFIIYDLCAYLLPQSTPFVKFTSTSFQNPGLFTFSKSIHTGKQNKDYYKGKIIILLNEKTQSSAEFHAMAYRVHPKVTVIGSTTAGADGNVSVFYLPGNIKTMISGIGVYYPDGKETQGNGIVPDIEIKPTINGIKQGRDELIEKAIEIINKK